MSTEFPNEPDEPANRPPAREFPPPALPRQAEAFDWARPRGPTGRLPSRRPIRARSTTWSSTATPRSVPTIGKAPEDSDLDYDWLVPTDDAWRSGDRTVQCAAYDPNISRLTRSLRGTRQ